MIESLASIDLRCRKCRTPLAGPVRPLAAPPPATTAEGPFLPLDGMREGRVLGQGARDGIWLHPDWLGVWRSDWAEYDSALRSVDGADEAYSMRYATYGCCGAVGPLLCGKGHPVGELYADCGSPHWLCLDEDRVQRSDRGEGWWEVYRVEEGLLYRLSGMMRGGLRIGDWTLCRTRHGGGPGPEAGLLSYDETGTLVASVFDL